MSSLLTWLQTAALLPRRHTEAWPANQTLNTSHVSQYISFVNEWNHINTIDETSRVKTKSRQAKAGLVTGRGTRNTCWYYSAAAWRAREWGSERPGNARVTRHREHREHTHCTSTGSAQLDNLHSYIRLPEHLSWWLKQLLQVETWKDVISDLVLTDPL